jgi:uncharacterized coiled-coil protein SlyX
MTYADAAHNAALMTGLERAYELRIAELELRLAEMEKMYDKAAADLIEALDVASAYRATASTLHQEVERRNGVERRSKIFDPENTGLSRHDATYREGGDRRKSWPR